MGIVAGILLAWAAWNLRQWLLMVPLLGFVVYVVFYGPGHMVSLIKRHLMMVSLDDKRWEQHDKVVDRMTRRGYSKERIQEELENRGLDTLSIVAADDVEDVAWVPGPKVRDSIAFYLLAAVMIFLNWNHFPEPDYRGPTLWNREYWTPNFFIFFIGMAIGILGICWWSHKHDRKVATTALKEYKRAVRRARRYHKSLPAAMQGIPWYQFDMQYMRNHFRRYGF
jgi:hypothetical protein